MSFFVQANMKSFLCLSPQLLRMVCDSLEKHDHVVLLRVCRQLYRHLIPFVWETVDDVVALVKLIPGVVQPKIARGTKVCGFS
jgi:hypothetical protein